MEPNPALPALLGAPAVRAPQEVTFEGRKAREYQLPHSSKAIIVHAARMLEVVASVDPRATRDLQQLQAFADNLTVSLATVENPNSLAVHAQITGLPDVPKIVKQIAQASRATAIRRSVVVVPSQP